MKALHLPEKTNTTEKPWQNERGIGTAKGYKRATILEALYFMVGISRRKGIDFTQKF